MNYKIKIEIPVFSNLSPRYFISQNKFKKIREDRIKLHGMKCECCDKPSDKLELHESYTIKDGKYTFDGFYLLCLTCHDDVHYINMGSFIDSDAESFKRVWKRKEGIQKYSIYKDADDFSKNAMIAMSSAFDFIMAKNISTDYSKVSQYGIALNEVENNFNNNFSHTGKIKLLLITLLDFFMLHKAEILKNPEYHLEYRKEIAGRRLVLFDEYMKHRKFYADNYNILYGGAKSKERDRIISDYARKIMLKP